MGKKAGHDQEIRKNMIGEGIGEEIMIIIGGINIRGIIIRSFFQFRFFSNTFYSFFASETAKLQYRINLRKLILLLYNFPYDYILCNCTTHRRLYHFALNIILYLTLNMSLVQYFSLI